MPTESELKSIRALQTEHRKLLTRLRRVRCDLAKYGATTLPHAVFRQRADRTTNKGIREQILEAMAGFNESYPVPELITRLGQAGIDIVTLYQDPISAMHNLMKRCVHKGEVRRLETPVGPTFHSNLARLK